MGWRAKVLLYKWEVSLEQNLEESNEKQYRNVTYIDLQNEWSS